MSCCGKKRTQFRTAIPLAAASSQIYVGNPQSTPAKATFAFVGSGGMTIVGAATGNRYTFSRPGATVEVDARDRPMLARLRHLQQIK